MDHIAEFEAFAAAEADGLLRYAMVLTGDPELARDLVQDALYGAFRRWSVVASAEHPRAYVRAMVTNAFLSWRRRWTTRMPPATCVVIASTVHHRRQGRTA